MIMIQLIKLLVSRNFSKKEVAFSALNLLFLLYNIALCIMAYKIYGSVFVK